MLLITSRITMKQFRYISPWNQRFYASDLDDCLNLNPEMLSSVKSYTVKGEIYETSHTVLYDALNEGTSGVHNERRPVSSELLYDEVYRPPF